LSDLAAKGGSQVPAERMQRLIAACRNAADRLEETATHLEEKLLQGTKPAAPQDGLAPLAEKSTPQDDVCLD